jgi:RNA polymerase sigma-70 factor, ECF subfamily
MATLTFEELYDAHARDVHRFALYLSGDSAEADEITSETFLRAWTAATPLRGESAKSYLLRIARNLFVDEKRRQGRHEELQDAHPDRAMSPERRAEFAQTMTAIRSLPPEYREPLLLHAAGGLSYDEIAVALNVGLPTVKMRIHRARLKLMEMTGYELERKR